LCSLFSHSCVVFVALPLNSPFRGSLPNPSCFTRPQPFCVKDHHFAVFISGPPSPVSRLCLGLFSSLLKAAQSQLIFTSMACFPLPPPPKITISPIVSLGCFITLGYPDTVPSPPLVPSYSSKPLSLEPLWTLPFYLIRICV